MKILVALLLLVALVVAPYTVEVSFVDASALPWRTFSETVKDAVNVGPSTCGEKEILRVDLEVDGRTFAYFAASNGRYLFAELGASAPIMIYTGTQLPSPDQDVIKVESHPYNPERDGAGPCGHLFPQTA